MLTTNQLNQDVALRFTMETDESDERERSAERATTTSAMRFVAFFAVLIVVLGGLHYYIWARLIRDTHVPQPWATAMLVGLIVLATGLPLMRFVVRRWPGVARILSWPFYTWLGVAMLLFFLLLGGDVVKLAVWIGHKLRAHVIRARRRGRGHRRGGDADGGGAALGAGTGGREARSGVAGPFAQGDERIHFGSAHRHPRWTHDWARIHRNHRGAH
jgi:hypothetical protein